MIIKKQTLSDVVLKQMSRFIASLNPIQSDWKYISLNGRGASGGIGVGIGFSGGVLTVEDQSSGKLSIKCGSGDAGVGLSPVFFNFSFPLRETPGGGVVFKLPSSGSNLSANDFRGPYFAFTPGAGCGPTVGVTFLFMGARFIPFPPFDLNSLVIQMITNSQILVVSAGVGASLPDASITCSMGIAI